MAMTKPALLLEQVRKLAAAGVLAKLSDAELLKRFAVHRDELAFEMIVQRHGALVFGVCRRLVANREDAEDAFQATFMVLARKAGASCWQPSISTWLYAVAYKVASRIRARSSRRKRQAIGQARRSAADPLGEMTGRELLGMLDEEMNRLPAKYRASLVLCYLEDATRDEAAKQLGCTVGTLKGHLEKGRRLLRGRLARRGVALPAALLAGAWTAHLAASVPKSLAWATVQAALAFATDAAGPFSAKALIATQAVLHGLLIAKWKTAAAFVLMCGAALAGGAWAFHTGTDADPAAHPVAERPPAPPKNTVPETTTRTDLYGDPLPPGAMARMGTMQFRHPTSKRAWYGSDPIMGAAFSPDGNVIATSLWDRLRVWNAKSGRLLFEIQNPELSWGQQVFSPDGRFIAAALAHYTDNEGSQAYTCLWDARTGKLRQRFPPENGLGSHVGHVLFSPDSKRLALTDDKGVIHLWDTDTGKEVAVLSSRSSKNPYAACIAFSPDGKTLVTLLHQPRKIWHWDIARGEVTKVVSLEILDADKETVEGRTGVYNDYLLSEDGRTLACLFFGERSVRLLDTSTGKVRCRLEQQTPDSVLDANGKLRSQPDENASDFQYGRAFAAGGRFFALAKYTKDRQKVTVALCDVETGKRKRQFNIPPQRLRVLTFSSDASRALIGGYYIRLYDVATGNELLNKPAHEGAVYALAFTPDSRTLLSGGADGMLGIWDAATGENRYLLKTVRGGSVTTLATAARSSAVVSGGQDGIIRLHDWRNGKEVRRFGFGADEGQQFAKLIVSGDGKTVVSQVYTRKDSQEPPFHSWDLATGELLKSFAGQAGADFADLSTDGERFIGVTYSTVLGPNGLPQRGNAATVEVRELGGGRPVFTMQEMNSLWIQGGSVLTADARLLIRTTLPGEIRQLELASGKERLRIVPKDKDWDGYPIALAPDRRILATATKDHTLQLWDLMTGKEVLRRSGYADKLYRMTFSPNGRFLATAHEDGAILVWDVSLPRRKASPEVGSAQALDSCWKDLAADDASRAHAAIGRLVESPQQAVGLFRGRLRPAANRSAPIAQLIAQLDDPRFAVRTAAAKELEILRFEAEPALRLALQQKTSLELRRRIEQILDLPLCVRDPDLLRGIRALEVLEDIALSGTDGSRHAAMDLLKKVASGASEARLTREATAVLRRLSVQ